MAIIFLLLFVIALVALIVGLVKPNIFHRLLRGEMTRKKVGLIFGTASLAFFILMGIFAPPVEEPAAVTTVREIEQRDDILEPSVSENNEDVASEEIATDDESVSLNVAQGIEQNNSDQTAPTESNNALHAVTAVVDGDTFKVSIDGSIETVRAIGIDTPETVDPRKSVQCFGEEASSRAKALLTGKNVKLESDPTQNDRDIYGRLLRYAWLEDGTFFNKQMIVEGYAMEYTYKTAYQYQTEFRQAEVDARSAKRGLWADDACMEQDSGPSENQNNEPTAQPSGGHIFYTSSYYTSKFYYCDSDEGWKSLSPKYLKSFPSAEELLKAYPNRTLHEPCL